MSTETLYLIIVGGALLWPVVKLLAQIVYKQFESRLPANVQALIEQYADMAVKCVEQKYTGTYLKGNGKRDAALEVIRDLFIAAKLPAPDEAILGNAIEAAVYVLNQEKS